jgi:CBS domain-containing protein
MTSGSSTTIANQYLRDVMTREVTTIAPSASIEQAAHMMKALNVGVLPVWDGTQLVGMLTDRDIVIRVVAEQLSPGETTVGDAMTADATYCYEDQTVEQAVRVMAGRQIRRLPILSRDETLVGVVSLGDVALRSDEPSAAMRGLQGVSQPSGQQRHGTMSTDGSVDPQA